MEPPQEPTSVEIARRWVNRLTNIIGGVVFLVVGGFFVSSYFVTDNTIIFLIFGGIIIAIGTWRIFKAIQDWILKIVGS